MGTPTFEEQVNTVVSKMTTDDAGKTVLPEGIEASEEVMFAAKLAKRHRDTQSQFTKVTQTNKALQAENESLARSWEQDATTNLSPGEQAKLEEMKVQDPDRWRAEITKLEEAKRAAFQEKRKGITQEVSAQTELEQRAELLANHNAANPDQQITDEVIDNDIPPRIVKKLEQGEVSFEEFLNECTTYLGKGKVLNRVEADPDVDFASARGSNAPSEEALNEQSKSDYKEEIF